MPISFNHKAIFVHIPKTGGQSISRMLSIPKGSLKHFYGEGLTHLTLRMIQSRLNPESSYPEERINIDDYYIFTFVRNPYDKMLSEYRWRMNNRHAAIFNEPTRDFMEFTEYMELLLERWPIIRKDFDNPSLNRHREISHVVPQTYYYDERIDIYKHENFSDECIRLCDKLGISSWIPHINKGFDLPEHTERTKEITYELYKEDFDKFKYKP